jgi:hypothetical protein
MTRALFLVPRSTQPRPGLACVWTATGNPRYPLTRTWVDLKTASASANHREADPEPRSRLVCA